MQTLWGVDLGGTKIEGVVYVPGQHHEPLARVRVPTFAAQGYEAIVSNVTGLIEELERQSGLSRPDVIGIGTPGSTDPGTGLMRNCNTVCLNGRSLKRDLSQQLGVEARLSNDANCFALAESQLGSAQGAHTVFGVILGTGVGGGVVVDGNIIEGANGIAGEWGHNLADPEGEPCYCGRVGCVETVLSGPAIEKWFASVGGEYLSLKEILIQHRTGGNSAASLAVVRLCTEFGRCLAQVVNVIDPDCIVLGGGVSQTDELYSLGTDELRKHVFHESPRIDVRRPALGDSAGVFGAALLARPSGSGRG